MTLGFINSYFSQTLVPHLCVFFFSVFLFRYLAPVARNVRLVDSPDLRKAHVGSVPLVGGLGIFLSVSVAVLLVPFGMSDFRYLFFSSTILLIVGVLDDYHEISAVAKFIGQGLVAATMVLAGGLEIPNVGDIFMWEDGNTLGTGVLAAPLTIIAIVGVVNSMNMVDGHDGLAGSIFLVTACSLIIIAGASESWKLQYLISLFVVAVLVFLVFNLPFAFAEKNKIFLGDAGSMLLGLILVWMMLELVIEPGVLKAVSGPWLLGVPLLDMFCVISLRIMSRISPLVADRQHLHHFLSDWGLSKRLVLLVILLIHLGFCLIGVFGSLYDWPDAMLFWPMFLIFGIYLFVRIRFEPR